MDAGKALIVVIGVLGCPMFTAMGALAWRHDFSFMNRRQKDGRLWSWRCLSWLEDTPENRRRASREMAVGMWVGGALLAAWVLMTLMPLG